MALVIEGATRTDAVMMVDSLGSAVVCLRKDRSGGLGDIGRVSLARSLVELINAFIDYFNETMARPFRWTCQGRGRLGNRWCRRSTAPPIGRNGC